MKYTIRLANNTEYDVKRLYWFLLQFAAEHKLGSKIGVEPDFEKGIPLLMDTILNKTCWIAEDEAQNLVGSLALRLGSPWYTNKPHYGDLWFYVLPEFRNSTVALGLIKTIKEFAASTDIPVTLGIFNSDDAERKLNFYKRLGLTPLGGTFLVENNHG